MASMEGRVGTTASDESASPERSEPLAELATLVERFRIRAHRHARGHYLAGKRNASMHIRLGTPAVTLSAIVGSAIFATISSAPELWLVISTGTASVVAAVLTALQTFFGFSDLANKHRVAGAAFAAFKRDLDIFAIKLKSVSTEGDETMNEVGEVAERFNKLQQNSPDIPDHYYDQARREQSLDIEGV